VIFKMTKVDGCSLPVMAIDLGGTKIAAGIVSARCEILAREYCPTLADEGVEAVIERIVSAVGRLVSQQGMDLSQLCCISIAACGAIDSETGVVVLSPNLPGWCDIPLRSMVGERLGVKTLLINDANAAAWGEYHLGVGKGVNNLIYLTVGTGIGGAIIIDGRLYTGSSGSAGEIGHMTIDTNGVRCGCGNIGCLETLASGTAITREAVAHVARGEASSLTDIVAGRLEDITAEKVAVAAKGGDPLALGIINKAATYLGMGMVNLVNIFNPEMIVVGGGVAKMGDLLLNPARGVVREKAFPVSAEAVSIVSSQLGSDAGILGAAIFALQQESE